MAVSEQRPEDRSLKSRITDLLAQNWIGAATNPDNGALGFSDSVPILNRLKDLLLLLDQVDLSYFPLEYVKSVHRQLDDFAAWLSDMRNFDILQNNARNIRDGIEGQLQGHYEAIFNTLAAPMAVVLAKDFDRAAIKTNISNEVIDAVSSIFAESGKAAEQIREANAQVTETLAAIKKAAAQVGVSANAKVFADQANEHKASATLWMRFTLVAALLTVGWGTLVLWGIPIHPAAPISEIVQQAIAKLIVFSGLSYGLLWCARNYSANRHNYVLNKHRQNSLATFETFAKAAEGDPDTKNAILLQATTSIFAAQTSGYLTKEPEIDQPSKIVEIMRSVKGG